MGEDRVLRDLPGQRPGERRDVIDALAGERALVKHVLVEVRHRERVGIDALPRGVEHLEGRGLLLRGQARGHARLEDRVAADHLRLRIVRGEVRGVQWMRHLPHQPLGGGAGQARVRVQGDHIAERARQVPLDRGEGGARVPREHAVQLLKLAALALPAHPHALGGVPHTPAVEEEEPLPIGVVQPRHPGPGLLQQLPVPGPLGGVRVRPVRGGREVDLPVVIAQEVGLEGLQRLLHRTRGGDHRGHHHERAVLLRHAIVQAQLRHGVRGDQPCQPGPQPGHHEVRDRQDEQEPQQDGGPRGQARPRRGDPPRGEEGEDERSEDHEAHVAGHAGALDGTDHAFAQAGPVGDRSLEEGGAAVHQPVAHVLAHLVHALLGEAGGPAGDGELVLVRAAGQALDAGAVEVAGGEVLLGVARRTPQLGLHGGDGLQPGLPVHIVQLAHGHHDVAHGERGLRLLGQLALDRRLRVQTAVCEDPVDPLHRLPGRALGQAPQELDRERAGGGGGAPLGQGLGQGGGTRVRVDAEQGVRERVRAQALAAGGHDPRGQAAGVLHQEHAHVDGHGPEFSELQGAARIVGLDVAGELVRVQARVRVRHVRPHDREHARMALEEAGAQLGQQLEVAARQVPADQLDLLLDGVEVVDEPLGRRGDRLALIHHLHHRVVVRGEDPLVLPHPREEGDHRAGALDRHMGIGQCTGVAGELLVREPGRADEVVIIPGGPAATAWRDGMHPRDPWTQRLPRLPVDLVDAAPRTGCLGGLVPRCRYAVVLPSVAPGAGTVQPTSAPPRRLGVSACLRRLGA